MGNILLPNKEKKPRPHACCNVPANLNVYHPAKDKTIEVCKVCNCRHFRLKVDPLKFNLTMT